MFFKFRVTKSGGGGGGSIVTTLRNSSVVFEIRNLKDLAVIVWVHIPIHSKLYLYTHFQE